MYIRLSDYNLSISFDILTEYFLLLLSDEIIYSLCSLPDLS